MRRGNTVRSGIRSGDRLAGSRAGLSQWGLMTTIILFAVVTLMILYLLGKLAIGANDTFNDREACRLSVLAHDALLTEMAGKTVTNVVSIDCKRRLVEVGAKRVEVAGKRAAFYDGAAEEFIGSYDGPTNELVNALVLDEVAGCWYQFLEGKVDFLEEATFDWADNERRCFICSEISFAADALPLAGEGAPEQFRDYLRRAKIRTDFGGGKERTGAEYLFDNRSLCNARYDDWENTFGDTTVLAEDSSCVERYVTFWSDIGLSSVFKTRITTTRMDAVEPFTDPLITLQPTRPRDKYLVLYMVEGGSWGHRVLGSIMEFLAFWDDEESDEGKPTHAVWVIPAENLGAATCDAYFA